MLHIRELCAELRCKARWRTGDIKLKGVDANRLEKLLSGSLRGIQIRFSGRGAVQ